MVKLEKFGHFHLVYHFTVPLKEYFTSTSASLTIWTSFSTGQVCSGIVAHLPKLNTFLQSLHLSNHEMHDQLDCLYLAHTSIDWPHYFCEFAGFCWQQIFWTSLLYFWYIQVPLCSQTKIFLAGSQYSILSICTLPSLHIMWLQPTLNMV